MKGRLRREIDFWKEIQAPQYILDVTEFGYKVPLLQIPTPFSARNNSTDLVYSVFVENPIIDLIKQGCVVEVFEEPIVICSLSVSIQKSGEKRHILTYVTFTNYKKKNYKKKFRCEDLSVAKKILRLAYYMFSFDLKSGYHHVGIFPDSQK